MRNLKKILALALALVMTMSVMSVASAKSLGSYADAGEVSAKHAVAVDVSTQLGILEGMTENSYEPQGTLTRAQLATMIYRIATGDVAGKMVGNYANGAEARFSDVSNSAWYAGYVAYCADAGYLQGMGDGTYAPNSTLTGYQALAALLRVIGYDANNEFTGSDWTVEVAKFAKKAGIEGGVIADLNGAITREQAAQFVYNALFAARVTYTPAFGYTNSKLINTTVSTLARDVFHVKSDKYGDTATIDAWGRPATVWYDFDGDFAAVIAWNPLATYTTAVTECEIASVLGLNYNVEWLVDTFTNGVVNFSETPINAVDTINKIGAQGQLVEVYEDRLVIIDTYLADVESVYPATFDKAGHMKTLATITLKVHDGAHTTVTLSSVNNWEYVAGSKVLVNAWTVGGGKTVDTTAERTNVEILGVASSVVGPQTTIWQNAAQHTVNGATYADAIQFNHDEALNIANKPFTWFFDQYNNLIGAFEYVTAATYVAIKDIQWVNPLGTAGYAVATLVNMDGTVESNVVIGAIGDKALSYTLFQGDFETGAVSANYAYNTEFVGTRLYTIAKNALGVATLTEVVNSENSVVVSGAVVTKGNPMVLVNNVAAAYIDDATQFLVWNTKTNTWTAISGYNQIPSMNANVYAINQDADAAAELVYMYGTDVHVSTASANIVYVNNVGYNYAPGSENYTLLDAYIKGVLTPVVMDDEWFDGQYVNVEPQTLYYMVDGDGNGVIDNCAGTADSVINLIKDNGGVNVLDAIGTTARYLTAGSYSLLANAIQVTGEVVPYNNTTAVLYNGTALTGAENIVIIYNGWTISEIYVIG